MSTKLLMSYDQLNPQCCAKQLCDMFRNCQGEIKIDGQDKDAMLHYEIVPSNGNLIIKQFSQTVTLTPCDAKQLMEIIDKFYITKLYIDKEVADKPCGE